MLRIGATPESHCVDRGKDLPPGEDLNLELSTIFPY